MAENIHTNIENTDQCLKAGFPCFQHIICVLLKVKNLLPRIPDMSCSSFDLHKVIIGLENQFLVSLEVAALDRFYCTSMCFIYAVLLYWKEV